MAALFAEPPVQIMFQLLSAFWQIAVFQRRPQDLPASDFLLRLTAAFYLLVGLATALLPLPLLPVVAIAILDTLLLAVLIVAALYWLGLRARAVQTLTAVYGALGLIGLLMLPVSVSLSTAADAEQTPPLPGLLLWLLSLWSIAVLGNILRHALSISLLVGVLISYGYFLLWQQLLPLFIGSPST